MPQTSASNLSIAACFLSLFICIVGLFVFILVLKFWSTVSPYYSKIWIKRTLTLIKGVSAVPAFWAKDVTGSDRGVARLAAFWGIVGLIVWELIDLLASDKHGDEEAAWKKKFGDLLKEKIAIERQSYIRNKLIAYVSQLISYKRERICEAIGQICNGPSRGNRNKACHAGLGPSDQILHSLQLLSLFLVDLLPANEQRDSQNFRIGFYVENNGVMAPVASWDHRRKQRQFLRSYKEAPDKFRLDADDPAYAVRCVRENCLLIVPDCASEASFFHDGQKNYLRSLVAYPILDCCDKLGRQTVASLVIDTDVAGHFTEKDRPTIQTYMEQFARRIEFESTVKVLLQAAAERHHGEQRQKKRS